MKRHIVLTLGRSGSNTLVNMINQHPNALNIGEVLGDWNRIRQIANYSKTYRNDIAAYLDVVTRGSPLVRGMCLGRNMGRFLRMKSQEIKPMRAVETLGIKEFATLIKRSGAEDWLRAQSDLRVIGLVRSDVLARMVSWQMLDQTGVVKIGANQSTDASCVTIPPERIAEYLGVIQSENQLLMGMLAEIPAERRLIVDYDDLYRDAGSRQDVIDGVFRFLDLAPVQVEERMKKIVTTHPAERIANRVDCAEALKGTEFDGWL